MRLQWPQSTLCAFAGVSPFRGRPRDRGIIRRSQSYHFEVSNHIKISIRSTRWLPSHWRKVDECRRSSALAGRGPAGETRTRVKLVRKKKGSLSGKVSLQRHRARRFCILTRVRHPSAFPFRSAQCMMCQSFWKRCISSIDTPFSNRSPPSGRGNHHDRNDSAQAYTKNCDSA